jgi:drug/metabolite transporter (DMT)-like permease
MDKTTTLAYLKAIFAVTVWGASFIATKIALQEVSPITVVWLRFAVGVIILGFTVYSRAQLKLPKARELAYFALLGFIGVTFHQWLQSNGLVTSQASTTAWIVATTPVFMALLGWVVLKEKLGWISAAGILLAAFGVLLVVSKGDLTSVAQGQFGAPGDLLILISAPNWAVFSVLSRQSLKKHPAAMMMFYVMTLGWLFVTIQFLLGPGFGEIGQLSLAGWLGVCFLGIFCSALAYIFWYDALQALPASQAGAFLYLEPIVAVVVAAILLEEPLVLAALLGGVLILLGVWLVNRAGRPQIPKPSARR